MRVVCENCGATYKIPETKLVKEVNKATCRKCGFRMMIRRPTATAAAGGASVEPDEAATQVARNPLDKQANEAAVLKANTRIEKHAADEWSDEAPTQVQADPLASPSTAPTLSKAQMTAAGSAPGDMLLALVGTFAAAAGPMLLATNTADESTQRMIGLLLGLWGALICLFLLVTGNLWRQKGNVPISVALATVLSVGGTAFVELAMHSNDGSSAPPVAEVPAPDPADNQAAEDALAGGAETGDPTEDAAPVDTPEDGTADASPTPPPREASPTPETAREAPAPVEEEEELGEADMDDIPEAATRSDAEERRRREMEESAERARAERKAREEEKARKARAAPPPTGTPRMKSLPLTVVDTMIRSNMSVKRCFFAEKQASGSLPSRVNVRFTVMPTGRVSAARVTTDEYKGGSLDSCLGRSFKAIQFPAFEGDPLSMTYPFIL